MSGNKVYEIVIPQEDYNYMVFQFEKGEKCLCLEGVDGVTTTIRNKEGDIIEPETGRVVRGSDYLFEQVMKDNSVIHPNTPLGFIFCMNALKKGYTLVNTGKGIKLKRK